MTNKVENPLWKRNLALLACLAIAAILICPFIGIVPISLSSAVTQNLSQTESQILWQVRVPRVVLGFLCGAALSLCGVIFQAIFRNLLATPFTLGVSSGASLGASLAIRFGLTFTILSIDPITLFAAIGALGTVGLIALLTRTRALLTPATVLLTGVTLNFFFSSVIVFIQYISDFAEVFRITRWLMGSLGPVDPTLLIALCICVVGALLFSFFNSRSLDLISLSDEFATLQGVNIGKARWQFIVIASIVVALVVSAGGIIGFVGIVI
ncbi:MAG: iron ABC transporter permease, partial [Bdellovibrionales bacterium]|nr:iron ABC transporter permease [Bdellovibrionales bacterium]